MSLELQKGNLFNSITNQIDERLMDSSEYDLRVDINGVVSFYRIRYYLEGYDAKEIRITDKEFILPKYPHKAAIQEIQRFYNTDYFREDFPYRRIFLEKYQLAMSQNNNPDYEYFVKKMSRKDVLVTTPLYDFVIPALGIYEKTGVLAHQVGINTLNRRYYTIFVKHLVEAGFRADDNDSYMIYWNKYFEKFKEDSIKDAKMYAECSSLPINLVQYLLTISGGSTRRIKFFEDELLKIKNGRIDLRHSPIYQSLKTAFLYDQNLEHEFFSYIQGDKEDIEYGFKTK